MNQVINAAFIGCGAIAQKKHLPLCVRDENIHIKMLFDTYKPVAEKCQSQFGAFDTQVVDSVDAIFQSGDVDIVFVATPSSTHAELSIQALASGKHVICEKPMAITSSDAEAMLKAATDNNRMIHISYQNRYTNQAQYVKQLADEGFFSDVYYAKAYALRRRAAPTWGVATNKNLSGGGPLVDIGSHAIDLALWLSGNFKPLYVVGRTYDKIAKMGSEANFWGNWNVEKFSVEDCALGFVVMENGMTLTVDASYALNVAKEFEASVDLYGTTGGVELRQQEGVTLVHELGGKMCVTHNDLQMTARSLTPAMLTEDPSEREHRDFMQRILSGNNHDPAAEEACVVAKIVEAIYQSAADNKPVYIR